LFVFNKFKKLKNLLIMRPVLWGLIASLIGLAGWIFFSIIYTFAKMAGSEATLIAYFFLSLFFMVMLFGLPVGAAFDLNLNMLLME
jgi:hypothetical protein